MASCLRGSGPDPEQAFEFVNIHAFAAKLADRGLVRPGTTEAKGLLERAFEKQPQTGRKALVLAAAQ